MKSEDASFGAPDLLVSLSAIANDDRPASALPRTEAERRRQHLDARRREIVEQRLSSPREGVRLPPAVPPTPLGDGGVDGIEGLVAQPLTPRRRLELAGEA